VDASWKEVSDKNKNQNSPEMSMPCKQLEMNRYQPSKYMSSTKSFDGFEEFDDASTNIGVGKMIVKLPPIFVARVNNFSSFS
jgi:hypothetical protein